MSNRPKLTPWEGAVLATYRAVSKVYPKPPLVLLGKYIQRHGYNKASFTLHQVRDALFALEGKKYLGKDHLRAYGR